MPPTSRFWRDGLRMVSYCPLCDSEFNPMEAQLLDRRGETHLLHVRCRSCGNSMLAVVLVTSSGVSSVGLVTDLSFPDVAKFRWCGRVTLDDVLQCHEGWKQKNFFDLLSDSIRHPRA